jgi:hypothetical protein
MINTIYKIPNRALERNRAELDVMLERYSNQASSQQISYIVGQRPTKSSCIASK